MLDDPIHENPSLPQFPIILPESEEHSDKILYDEIVSTQDGRTWPYLIC